MNRNQAEQTVTGYLKKLYGFALKKTANLHDVEDLAQEIALKLYSALLVSEIDNNEDYISLVSNQSEIPTAYITLAK